MKFIKIFAILLVFVNLSRAQKFDDLENSPIKPYGNITAPDFPQGLEWLNTDKPISLKDLKGKIVLLDFWTYCCINCMHIIPDLHKLEEKYKNELVIVGVHSAKFLTERGTENIRQAILRYEIEHPVINDKDFEVWESYTANAWPTLVLIDPKGKVIGTTSGEGVYELFDPIISEIIKTYDKDNVLDRTPLIKFTLEKDKAPKSILSYPGKIAADPVTGRLFITDSNNNRILVLLVNESGDGVIVEEVIGTGKQGLKDGSYNESEFFKPQGIAFNNGKLYIADTENHLIREVDLITKQVSTIAGLVREDFSGGYQSKNYGIISGKANETALNSPWDIVVVGNDLFIAMAGAHQIWKLDLKTNQIGTYAGSGRENIVDGSFETSALAQTSGITTDGLKLYFADSEVSAVRLADLNPNGRVKTIVGMGLFDFGDIDGVGDKVRLQHPLGIVYNPADNLLYVADTYNNKIKTVNTGTREAKTYSGTGFAGNRDGGEEAQFNEPSGLTILNGKIYVTDTNNHLLRVIDMATKQVKTLRITNPDKLSASMRSSGKNKKAEMIRLEEVSLSNGETKIKFNFTLPEGYHINPEALPQVAVTSPDGAVENTEREINTETGTFEVPLKITGAGGTVNIEVLIYYCETEKEGVCKFKDLNFEVPISISPEGKNRIEIVYSLM
ncbi:MAG TPA: thioredoxin-like domain-containing protein [Ignavibacteria bacterium]